MKVRDITVVIVLWCLIASGGGFISVCAPQAHCERMKKFKFATEGNGARGNMRKPYGRARKNMMKSLWMILKKKRAQKGT
jgi:hypothetical protein